MKEVIEQILATKTRWWKLNEKEYREKFVQQIDAKLRVETKRAWRALSTVVRETGRNVLGCTSGRKERKGDLVFVCRGISGSERKEGTEKGKRLKQV